MVRNLTFLFVGIVFCSGLFAQDIHLTQYYFSPLNYNPAATGRFDGDFRVVGNFRSQWGAVMDEQFVTSSASYEQNFNLFGQQIALGAVYLNDNSGLLSLTQNKLQLSAGYTFTYKGNYISTGIQTGLLHKGVDFSNATFPNQFNNNTGGFDGSLDNNQNFIRNNEYLPDLNLGVIWGRQISEKLYPEIGFSTMHINQPSETFLGISSSNLKIRNIYDLKLNYKLNDTWTFVPTFLYMTQNRAAEMLVGGLAKHNLKENSQQIKQIFGGVSFRDGFNRNYDAFAVIIGGVVREFQVGISYDANISPLSSISHYRGAFELSIIYIAKRTTPNIINVPCDRF